MPTKTLIAALVIALTAGGSAAFAVSAVSGADDLHSGQSLSGCLDPAEGTLSLSGAGGDCDAGTVPVVWNTAETGDEADGSAPSEDAAQDSERGATGATGAPGAAGEQGAPGVQGVAGRPGAAGEQGIPGAAGAPGAQGEKGAPGAPGEAGEAGQPGAQGAPGTPGVQGEKGEPGAPGAQGEKGEQGDPGVQGVQGQTGAVPWSAIAEWDAGTTYTAGPPASLVSYQGASYVAARSSVAAVPSASSSDWILVAAAGAKGDKGDQGDPGVKGDTGAQGPMGIQGIQGVAGSVGAAGQDGVSPWQFLGEYESSKAYTGVAPASVVQFGGSSWIAIRPQAFSGIEPGSDASVWSLLAAAGAQGDIGLTGPAGPQGVQGIQGPAGNSALAGLFGQNTGNASAGRGGGECVMGQVYLSAARVMEGIPANGQVMSIQQNTALFSLLGTTFGGDGMTTFKLPDLRAVAPNNMSYYICDQGIFPSYR